MTRRSGTDLRYGKRSPVLIGVLVGLLLSLASTAKAESPIRQILSPTTGPNDQAEYRYLELENRMGVLLISDSRADKAAAALDVHVGSGDDPDSRPGLAHFTEHMLFLGTETYPDPGEYHQFISSHGGSHNAYTAAQDTNYFFDVDPQHLESALDRFSSQFTVPTFAEELIERERHAVHSEYTAMLREDGRRFWSAFRRTFNDGHPLSRFTVGNLETLSNEEGELRDETIEFYKDHYSANIMTLVVMGPQSLDELQEMVVPRFAPVENRDLERTRIEQSFFDQQEQPRLMEVESLRDTRTLQLTFQVPSTRDQYETKPMSYLGHLIGHEGPGSLHEVLNQAGLVDEVGAGQTLDTGDQALMNISFSLTPEGKERWKEVVQLTFDYLEMIREDGIREAYFEEKQQLNKLELAFRERERPIRYTSSLAHRMHRVAPEDIVVAPWLYETYDPEAYKALLEYLRPEKALVSILAPFNDVDTSEWEQTKWYDTPFRITSLSASDLHGGANSHELSAQLKLPEPNPFIPEDLSLVEGPTMDHPVLMEDSPLQLWFARDKTFDAPRANVFLSLRSPEASSSPREKVLTRLMVDTVRHELNAFAYPARIAGLNYSVYDHLRGVTVQVSGYNDKLSELYHEILVRLRHPAVDSERFEIHRQRLEDELANAAKRRPQQIAVGRIPQTLVDAIHGEDAQLEAVRDLSADDLRDHIKSFYQALDPVMLVHGNMTHASSLNLGQRTRQLVLRDVEETEVPRSDVKRLAKDRQLLQAAVDHPDHGYVRYVQAEDADYETQALYRVLGQIISSPFYEAIRTDQQLGYIVRAMHFPVLEAPALAFIVQSPDYDREGIDERVETFLREQEEVIDGLSEEEFNQQKQAVITRLAEEDTRLREIAQRYWQEIDRKNYSFDRREKLIEMVEALSHEDVVEAYRQDILSSPRQMLVDVNRGVPRESEALQQILFDGVVPLLQ